MSSTSLGGGGGGAGEGGVGHHSAPAPPPPSCPLMAVAAAAAGLTVTYCIRGVTGEPACRSLRCPPSLPTEAPLSGKTDAMLQKLS